ncbi:A/G-specific adenine glycosylase [Anaerolentibacter hominis]|uniref:A/G-specific adenine glycosylase n=1 Tax=Anaerolentibacter hominis TaxID=3079009 RepID=UPI0031B827A1
MDYDFSAIVEDLLYWYDNNAGILRWRQEPKPYYIWISEIMLQQTRVEAVKDYFDRFVEALPDIRSLAEAEEERLLKLWEGLGYYNRVRNLKRAAEKIMAEYGGRMPSSFEELQKLPGIGSYTAGAIASAAFGEKVPAVDGNVLRVAMRLSADYSEITKQSVKKGLEETLKKIMPERPGDFNQSLMELGAVVCLPNGKPLCDKCPVMHLCRAFKQDIQMELPVKAAKRPRRIEERSVFILEYDGKYALFKRPARGLLAGLWELPNREGWLTAAEAGHWLSDRGLVIAELNPLADAKHIFSHVEWHMLGYFIRLNEMPEFIDEGRRPVWVTGAEIKERFALPSAFEAYTPLLV